MGLPEGRGFEVLRKVLDTLADDPGLSPAQLLERWRDEPEYERLAELAGSPLPELDDAAIGREITSIIGKIAEENGPDRRWTELIAKADSVGLTESETNELKDLAARKRDRPKPSSA